MERHYTREDSTGELAAGCVLIIVAFIIQVPAVIYRGFVLTKLWGWFVAAKFGLPALGVAEAIGLALVVGFLTKQLIREPKDERKAWEIALTGIIWALMWPTFALLIGWIVQMFGR